MKDYAPQLRTKLKAEIQERKVMEVFSWIGIGTTAYVAFKVIGWAMWFVWYVMEWGVFSK